MGLFGKKKNNEEDEEGEEETEEQSPQEPEKISSSDSGDISLGKIVADLEKLKASFSSFYELNKASNERFGRVNEQIGELRAMLIERDKAAQHLEAKATQAIDMVETIQPDKFMVELRKSDGKIEGLKANIESNETVLKNTIGELRDIRNSIGVFKGLDEVIKLSEEIKKELLEIKRVNADVSRHADQVDTIFSEMKKRFSEFDKFADLVTSADKEVKHLISDVDNIKIKMTGLATKKESEDLLGKFQDFEKHTSNLLNLFEKKFNKFQEDIDDVINQRMSEANKLVNGIKILATKTPDLNQYFDLLKQEAEKMPDFSKIEKVKQLGEEEKKEEKKEDEEKKGFLGKIFKKKEE